jgi:uncharacterized protein YaiL (DUF2058 family)
MSNSLQDQLKKSGLVDEKKAKQLKRAKHKEAKLARADKSIDPNQRQHELKQQQAVKVAKDRELNQKRDAQAQRKALAAQIKQLISMNVIAKDGEQKYSFTDGSKIKHIWVSHTQVEQLSHGTIAIAKQANDFVLVPGAVAEKIAHRDETSVVFKADKNDVMDEDDPYADYKIPDDLTW